MQGIGLNFYVEGWETAFNRSETKTVNVNVIYTEK